MSFSVIPIYRNFRYIGIYIYRIKYIPYQMYTPCLWQIINFCFTQMQSKRSGHCVLKTMSTASKLSDGVSTFEIIQNQNFLQISTKELSYLI